MTPLVALTVPDPHTVPRVSARSTVRSDRQSRARLASPPLAPLLRAFARDEPAITESELADLEFHKGELEAAGAKVISVSTDNVYSHLAWKGSGRLLENVSFSMAADTNGRVSRLFGVWEAMNR